MYLKTQINHSITKAYTYQIMTNFYMWVWNTLCDLNISKIFVKSYTWIIRYTIHIWYSYRTPLVCSYIHYFPYLIVIIVSIFKLSLIVEYTVWVCFHYTVWFLQHKNITFSPHLAQDVLHNFTISCIIFKFICFF